MRLYSTLQRDLVDLPRAPSRIGIYACGPTVYQRIHVGNARPFVLSMWLKRWLERRGYDVSLVENITDVNDKIYDAAPGRSAELAAHASEWYREDTDLLGLGRPNHEPKATETIPEIVALIDELVRRDLAYAAGGDVYFRVAQFPGYGRLSNQRLEDMQPEDQNLLKEETHDFALWKARKPGEDTWWDSPWGQGRPGWHIECSAMAEKFLGPKFEIHMGGIDLRFPHHENELAQSRGAGRDFAHIWMHNGMLEFSGEKMSKSLGNVVTLREALDEWGRETLLLFFMTTHWSKPMEYSPRTLEQTRAQWRDFLAAFYDPPPRHGPELGWEVFERALDDDFTTPGAWAVLHQWLGEGQLELLNEGLDVFGLQVTPQPPPEEVVRLAEDRARARADRRFEEADRLRTEVASLGWEARDKPFGFSLVPLV